MTEVAGPTLHAACVGLAALVGTWRGEGQGHYPTIEPFVYGEEVRVLPTHGPFLAYDQRTWAVQAPGREPGTPMHAERGYLRPRPDGGLEIVLAHPTGVVEVLEGVVVPTADGLHVDLAATVVGLTSTAKRVDALSRRFELAGDELVYDLYLGAVGQPLQHHLRGRLRRVVGE